MRMRMMMMRMMMMTTISSRLKIKNIWECEKIKKCGTNNEKDEGWICHRCDTDF
jgi:hypothetical protein